MEITVKKFNWRQFFSNFRGERMNAGDSEEQRYQAFKARFLDEERIYAKAELWDRWEPWIKQNFRDFDAKVSQLPQPCAEKEDK